MKNSKNLIPSVARGGAAVATVLSPLALAAPGDLDPGFADLGRLGPILDGPACTLDPLDDDSFYMAGGYPVTASAAAGCQIVALTAAGAGDPAFYCLSLT